jgi:ubiquinone/menaquinone biosynthesis C-methylase UbiE
VSFAPAFPAASQGTSAIAREVARSCGACGSERQAEFYSPADIVECLGCGVLYVSPRPTAEAIAAFYSAVNHYDLWDKEPGRVAMWRRRVRRVRRLMPAGRLLDIGAGQGDFGAIAREFFEVDGTEVSSEGQRLARERHGLSLRLGDATELDLPKEHYDVVTLWHVLEHVAEPAKLLSRCHAVLRPEGLLCVAVPNTRLPAGRNSEAPFKRLELSDPNEEIHLTHFTLPTLTALVERSGFALVERGLDDHSADNSVKARLRYHRHALAYRALGRALSPAIFVAGRKQRL